MTRFMLAAVLGLAAGVAISQDARAGDPNAFAGVVFTPAVPRHHTTERGLTARTVVIDRRTGAAIPTVTRLHPVVGSVQRKSHFTNPFTHKARYSSITYNPVLGTFGTRKFRR